MGLTLEEFKVQTLNNTYGNPPPVLVPNRGTYQGQCVSYDRQYCEAVLNIQTGAWGNAIDWWNNPKVLQYFDQITGEQNRRDGDILVWGDDPGTWTGEYGHIGIAYGGKILNQNFANSLKVSVNNFFSPGYLGALRLKGGNMPDTETILRSALNAALKANEVLQSALNVERKNNDILQSALNAERVKNDLLQKELDKEGTVLGVGKYVVK